MVFSYVCRASIMLALFLLVGASIPAQAQDAQALLKRLQEKYASIDALQAHFKQTMQFPGSNGGDTFSGQVVLKGDQYRVETGTQTLVTNGVTTWVYNPSEQQVLINDYQEDETAFSLNDFLFDYSDRYTVEDVETVQYEGERHYQLRLTPKARDTFFSEVRLWLRDRDDVVTRLEVTDINDTRMIYELTDIQLNPTVNNATFTFTPPKGVEVIDLRAG